MPNGAALYKQAPTLSDVWVAEICKGEELCQDALCRASQKPGQASVKLHTSSTAAGLHFAAVPQTDGCRATQEIQFRNRWPGWTA